MDERFESLKKYNLWGGSTPQTGFLRKEYTTIAGNCKYYINDLSFNYLYQGFGYGVGYMLENLVYLELKRAGYAVYVGAALPSKEGIRHVQAWRMGFD